jgi:hypothetical protein
MEFTVFNIKTDAALPNVYKSLITGVLYDLLSLWADKI